MSAVNHQYWWRRELAKIREDDDCAYIIRTAEYVTKPPDENPEGCHHHRIDNAGTGMHCLDCGAVLP